MEEFPYCRPKLKKILMDAMSDHKVVTLDGATIESVHSPSLGRLVEAKVNGIRRDGTVVVLKYVIKSPCIPWGFFGYLPTVIKYLHRIESFAYLWLLPLLKFFQARRAPFDAYPKAMGYFCNRHELATKEVLIVENMIHQGYVMRNPKEPLDFNHLQMVVKTYAEFHAIPLAIKQQHPHIFTGIDNTDLFRNMFTQRVSYTCIDHPNLMWTRILNLLDGDQYANHRKLLKKLSVELLVVAVQTAEMDEDDSDGLTVFGHGNSSLQNILFKYGDKTKPNVPTKVCLIDFQMLRYGSPIFDLSYFIFTATDKATRDEHYDQLIDIYYREVCMRLEQMGSPPAVVFPYDKFQLRLKRFSVLGYFMAQMALYTMLRAPSIKVTDQMTEAEIKESMERNIVESEALYDERIKGMLIDFVEKGYFDFLDEEYPDMEFDESTTDSTDDNMVDEEDL